MATLHTRNLGPSRTWRANQSPFTSPAADWPENATRAELVIGTADFTQPSQHATVTVEKSVDGGATWELVAEATFDGGTDRHGPITPGIAFTPDGRELLEPFALRARMATSGPNFTGPAVLNWWTEEP